MKHIIESIIGRKGSQFSPKDDIRIGDILVMRNGMCWYLQDDMMLTYYAVASINIMNVYIDDFLSSYDNMLRDIRCGEYNDCDIDIVSIYRSGNSIRNPNYKKIENFINHNSPIWKSK